MALWTLEGVFRPRWNTGIYPKMTLPLKLPELYVETRRRIPEQICQKVMWHADERLCWNFDHQMLSNQLLLFGREGGLITSFMSPVWYLRGENVIGSWRWKVETKEFSSSFLGESVSVSWQIRAIGAARRKFFLFFFSKKLFFLWSSWEALEESPTCRVDV